MKDKIKRILDGENPRVVILEFGTQLHKTDNWTGYNVRFEGKLYSVKKDLGDNEIVLSNGKTITKEDCDPIDVHYNRYSSRKRRHVVNE